ncbi:MAG: hypothetical protein WCV59_03235 [Parcubacteria group bacterium]|jgi:hypothetical protein
MTVKSIREILSEGGTLLRVDIAGQTTAEYATHARLDRSTLYLTCPTRGLGLSDNLVDIAYEKRVPAAKVWGLRWVSVHVTAFILREVQPDSELFFK